MHLQPQGSHPSLEQGRNCGGSGKLRVSLNYFFQFALRHKFFLLFSCCFLVVFLLFSCCFLVVFLLFSCCLADYNNGWMDHQYWKLGFAVLAVLLNFIDAKRFQLFYGFEKNALVILKVK